MKPWWVFKGLKFLLFALIAVALLSLIVMLLWNAVVPELFRGPVMTFWQAAGLLILSHILFHGWAPGRHSHGWHRERGRKRFEERLAAMTPEEREKFRSEWSHRCGPFPSGEGQ